MVASMGTNSSKLQDGNDVEGTHAQQYRYACMRLQPFIPNYPLVSVFVASHAREPAEAVVTA